MKNRLYGKLTMLLIAGSLAFASIASAESGMLYERWSGEGTAMSMLTEAEPADYTEIVELSQWGVGDDPDVEAYRSRLTGFVKAPVTGTYYFWINTDDNGALWLSQDLSPDGAELLCVETVWSDPDTWEAIGTDEEVSEGIVLQEGQVCWIRGGHQEGGGGDHVQIAWQCDEAGITAPELLGAPYVFTSPPDIAEDPIPADGAADIALDAILSWSKGSDPNGDPADYITGHHVYFGLDADNLTYRGLQDVAAADYDPAADGAAMVIDGVYYWRIDESIDGSGPSDPNTAVGYVWSFKSLRTVPDILVDPQDFSGIEGVYGIFSMEVFNPDTGDSKGASYEWKKVGDETVISTDAMLVIPDITDADEGEYYCTVSNSKGSRDSGAASLAVVNKVVHWAFDESAGLTAADSSGNDIDGTLSAAFTDASWIVDGGNTGEAGDNALDFAGSLETLVQATNVTIPEGVNDVFKGDSSWSLLVWINLHEFPGISMIGGWGRCSNVEGGAQDERYLNTWDASLEFQPGGDDGFWPGGDTGEGEWKLLAITYDSVSGDCSMYINDELIGVRTYTALADVPEKSIKVGASGAVAWAEPVGFKGLMDDFCIFDGALTAGDIQYLVGGSSCNEYPAMDFNLDCVVDSADLMMLLEYWLEDHMVR